MCIRDSGQTFLLYIVWYGVCRYFIEGLRTDSLLMHSADFRISQVLAALSAAAVSYTHLQNIVEIPQYMNMVRDFRRLSSIFRNLSRTTPQIRKIRKP